MKIKIAIATGGGLVSEHFGRARRFLIAEADEDGWRVLETRENIPACEGGEHSHERFAGSAKLISDCGAVIAARIGGFAQNGLNAMGVTPLEKSGFCEDILDGYVKYLARMSNARPRSDAEKNPGARPDPKKDEVSSAPFKRKEMWEQIPPGGFLPGRGDLA